MITEVAKKDIFKSYISICADYYTFVKPDKQKVNNVINLKFEEVKNKYSQMLGQIKGFNKALQVYFNNGY